MTVERAALPRSRRLRGGGSSGGGVGVVVVGGRSESSAADTAALAALSHSHPNKSLLDLLRENEGYLLLRQSGSDDALVAIKVKAGYADEAGEALTLSASSDVWEKFLRKDEEDTAAEVIHFAKGLDSGGFVPDSSGMGIYQDGDGNWVIEGDFFHVRKKLTAESVEVMHSSHIGGKLIASPGSLVVSRIEIPDGVAYYRCYFNTTDSEGNEIQNTIAVDDLAYCETFNLVQSPTGKAGNHYLWRRVIAVGADYIDLSASDCAAESDAPLVGDKITTLGNKTETTRQNAIMLAGAGTGNPYVRVYSGINSYVLPEPDVQLSPHGSWIKVRDKNGAMVRIDDLIESLEDQLSSAVGQSDRQVVLWFGEEIPTLLNAPAVEWDSELLLSEHVNDIYYNKGYASTGGGRAYSFERHEEGGVTEYRWDEITDRDVLASLEAANRAQDTADGKRRVFVGVPNPPYDAGDMWVNAVYPNLPTSGSDGVADLVWHDSLTGENYHHGEIFNNDIVRCNHSRVAGESFSVHDWEAVQEYTTSRILQTASQIILSVTNLATGLESAGVHIDGDESEVRVIANKTKFLNPDGVQVASFTAEGLQSNKVQCLDSVGHKRLEVDADGVRMYYPPLPGDEEKEPQVMKEEVIVLGSDGNVCGAETRFYNRDGSILWRIDSAGTLSTNSLQEYWTSRSAYVVEETAMQMIFNAAKNGKGMTYGFTHTTGRVTNDSVSSFTSIQGNNSSYNGMVARGTMSSSAAPGVNTPWLTGWLLSSPVATLVDEDREIYCRCFVFYENGLRSTTTLECALQNISVNSGELRVYFDALGAVTDIDPLDVGSEPTPGDLPRE